MEGWNKWMGKKVYLVLNDDRKYSGKIVDVDDTSAKPLIWITILDKFNKQITFLHSEIKLIQEEE